jgi:hypothetical protein
MPLRDIGDRDGLVGRVAVGEPHRSARLGPRAAEPLERVVKIEGSGASAGAANRHLGVGPGVCDRVVRDEGESAGGRALASLGKDRSHARLEFRLLDEVRRTWSRERLPVAISLIQNCTPARSPPLLRKAL